MAPGQYRTPSLGVLSAAARRFSTRHLSEHCGSVLKVSLCLERQPLEFAEDEVHRLFREFRELWSLRTQNSLKIPSLATIERKITHKLARSREKAAKPAPDDSSDREREAAPEEELESLLSAELDLSLLPRRSRRVAERETATKAAKLERDDDLRNINRLPRSWLFLLVKYRAAPWSLPVTPLYHGDSVRQTLARLCEEQISASYRPFFLGYAPFTYQRLPFDTPRPPGQPDPGGSVVDGEKVFYYRARHVPTSELGELSGAAIEDYAWCTLDELRARLDALRYHKVLSALPLYNLS